METLRKMDKKYKNESMCSAKLRPFPSQIATAAASIAVVVWQVNILVAGIYYPSFFILFFFLDSMVAF